MELVNRFERTRGAQMAAKTLAEAQNRVILGGIGRCTMVGTLVPLPNHPYTIQVCTCYSVTFDIIS